MSSRPVTLVLNTNNALGGAGTNNPSTIANVIVQAGGTLNLNAAVQTVEVTNPINGNITFEPGATFLADELVPAVAGPPSTPGGPFNGTGTADIPARLLHHLVRDRRRHHQYLDRPAAPLHPCRRYSSPEYDRQHSQRHRQHRGLRALFQNPAQSGHRGLQHRNQHADHRNRGLSFSGNPGGDNLNLSGAVITATMTGGNISQGGGRIIIGAGGVTLAGGSTVVPANASDGSETLTFQEDFEFPVSGATLTIGSSATINGLTKFGTYVGLNSQGSRSVVGGIIDVTNGAQLQLSTFLFNALSFDAYRRIRNKRAD